jgi:hypothetical protein
MCEEYKKERGKEYQYGTYTIQGRAAVRHEESMKLLN